MKARYGIAAAIVGVLGLPACLAGLEYAEAAPTDAQADAETSDAAPDLAAHLYAVLAGADAVVAGDPCDPAADPDAWLHGE